MAEPIRVIGDGAVSIGLVIQAQPGTVTLIAEIKTDSIAFKKLFMAAGILRAFKAKWRLNIDNAIKPPVGSAGAACG